MIDISIPSHERVVKAELAPGIFSIIAIHNTARGPALGGLRFFPYANDEDALKDVLSLSEAMSYKAALADLPLGGGKAVIMGDPEKIKSPELLLAFADFVNILEGKYITAKDVGLKLEDLDTIATRTKFVAGTTKGGSGDPSPMTAYGVFCGIKAAAQYVWKTDSVKGLRVFVEGLGSVGYELARLIAKEKGVVYGYDLHPEVITRAQEELGLIPMDPKKWAHFDLWSPCAMGGVVQAHNIPQLSRHGVRVVAGAANNQLSNEQADGWRLHREWVLYAPDYIINSGGLINVATELQGYDRKKVMQKVEKIGPLLLEIFARARKEDHPTTYISHAMALERLRKI